MAMELLVSYPEVLLAIVSYLCLSLLRLILRCQKSGIPVKWPVVGMLPFLVRNRHHIHDKFAHALHEAGCNLMFTGPWFLDMDFFLSCDPATVNHCLSAKFNNYPKGGEFAEMLDFLGNGIIVSDSESWEYQRHMAMHILGSRAYRTFSMSTITTKAGATLLPYLEGMARRGSEVELEGVFMRFLLDVTYTSAFATDLDGLSMSLPIPALGQATKTAEEAVMFRHTVPRSLWKLLRALKVGSEKKMAGARAVIDRHIYEEIAKRKAHLLQGQGEEGDVLSMCIKWPMDPSMSEQHKTQFLRDTVLGFIFAAKDLTAVTLTWFFYMMCNHPHVEARIIEEITALLQLQSTTMPAGSLSVLDGDMLRQAVYLQAAFLETLRLFPASPFEEVEAVNDDVLPNGTRLSKGTRIVFSLYAMGRLEGIWGKDCAEFRPERWLSKSSRLRHQPGYKFPAFNAGPRSCVGKDLALGSMKMIAASIIYNFKVQLVEGHAVMPGSSIVLHTRNGIMVNLKRREAAAA
ncbi:hypothetical protein CFC21_063721 [Triticum aestivum]|uniref:Cytochrome P450 n=2 Tax=Triticum aestivum TaxID=4565 RepID=A0A3B6JS71_WHEAT|nr:noroxomaritidine synthase-like [Triticum aestivum]KAF7056304.1 hypothetical protein CFC21_063721 [Triticum aestivum]